MCTGKQAAFSVSGVSRWGRNPVNLGQGKTTGNLLKKQTKREKMRRRGSGKPGGKE